MEEQATTVGPADPARCSPIGANDNSNRSGRRRQAGPPDCVHRNMVSVLVRGGRQDFRHPIWR